MSDIREDCPECGFNQKDEDERDLKEKRELIGEFKEVWESHKKLRNYKAIDDLIKKWEA